MKLDVRDIVKTVRDLRDLESQIFDQDYWAQFIDAITPLCLSDGAALLRLSSEKKGTSSWFFDKSALEKTSYDIFKKNREDIDFVLLLAERCLENSFALSSPETSRSGHVYLLVNLPRFPSAILLLSIPTENRSRISEALLRAQLIADIPCNTNEYASHNPSNESYEKKDLHSLLHLLIDVNQAKNFNSSAYALVNGLVAASDQIDQVAIGWQEGEYIRIKTISHYDRFEKKTELVKAIESALEESADQRSSILFPDRSSDSSVIQIAHRQLKTQLEAKQIFTFPLYDSKGEVQASIMLVSWHHEFSIELLNAVSFISSLLFEPLERQKQKSDGVLVRSTRTLRSFSALMLGRQYVWTKLISIFLFLFFVWGFSMNLPHRVSAVSQMVTDSTQLMSAPYDGHLSEVQVTSGDLVETGQKLARLDIQELMLQLAELQAELQRAQGEVDKARAGVNLIDTKIAEARLSQVRARMQRTEYFLSQATLVAPFSGFIVGGERQELMGAPVRKGQIIFRIARIEGLYLLLQVSQDDIDFVKIGSSGEFALVSQPEVKYSFTVEQIIPVAKIQGAKGAHFEVKARFDQEPQSWWRPGMTGSAKVHVGEAPAFWVLSHKALNRLRMFLWW